MKNLMIERLRDAVRDAYPPGQTVVRTRDLEWLLNYIDPPKPDPCSEGTCQHACGCASST